MIENKVNISQVLGNRFDVSFYNARLDFVSNLYPSFNLGQLVYINPSVSFDGITDNEEISFIPMESIDEQNGTIKALKTIQLSKINGFTKFQEGDLLWAKITPCMQNGKSAIARNLKNGVGCGSTEYFVIRPKTKDLLIEYIYLILRHSEVLKAAQGSFGGSAGQQRVSSQYLKSIVVPLPNKDIQQSIVDNITNRKQRAKQLHKEGIELLERAKEKIEEIIIG